MTGMETSFFFFFFALRSVCSHASSGSNRAGMSNERRMTRKSEEEEGNGMNTEMHKILLKSNVTAWPSPPPSSICHRGIM